MPRLDGFDFVELRRWCNRVAPWQLPAGPGDFFAERGDAHLAKQSLPKVRPDDPLVQRFLHENQRTTFPFAMDYPIGSRWVARFDRVAIRSDFFLFGDDNHLIAEAYHGRTLCQKVLHAHPEFHQDVLTIEGHGAKGQVPLYVYTTAQNPESLRNDNGFVIMGSRCADNYWHWITEVLPRAWILEELPALAGRTLIYPELKTAFQRDSLAAIGIDPANVRQVKAPAEVTVDNAVVPSMLSPGGYGPAIPAWYRRRLGLARAHEQADKTRRRLFISRGAATRRLIEDEARLYAAVAPLGFEYLVPDKLSFAEQVALFASAEVVIGAMGSNLTNVIFARPGTKVIEIAHEKLFAKYIWFISNACGHAYNIYVGSAVPGAGDATAWNIRIDPKDFVGFVESALAQTS